MVLYILSVSHIFRRLGSFAETPCSRVCVYTQQPLHAQRVLHICVHTHKAEDNSGRCLAILDDGEVFHFRYKSARGKLRTPRAKSKKRIQKMPFWRAVRNLVEKAPQPSRVFPESRAEKKGGGGANGGGREVKFNVRMEDG